MFCHPFYFAVNACQYFTCHSFQLYLWRLKCYVISSISSYFQAVAEIAKASKHEACSLPTQAESYFVHVMSVVSEVEKKARIGSDQRSKSSSDGDIYLIRTSLVIL